MFLGQTVNLIDEKNRLVLPTRYREELGYSFYMVLDFDKCLSFYPSEIYKKKAEKINSLDDFSSAARSVKRVFSSLIHSIYQWTNKEEFNFLK